MGILHKTLQLSIAATMKMMMVTLLMLACLATNILSRTYLIETADKDHGYWRRRMMMPQDDNLVDDVSRNGLRSTEPKTGVFGLLPGGGKNHGAPSTSSTSSAT